jgi:phage tail sheath protein FI
MFSVSPGVNVSEIDLTTVIPAVSTSSGAVAGPFDWGPVETVRQVSNENELVSIFGKPSTNTAQTFFTAANFLAYASDLRVIRAANTGSRNASANVTANNGVDAASVVYCPNEEAYEANSSLNTVTNVLAIGRYPGILGNSLKVSILANTSFGTWEYANMFDKPPGTSYFVSSSFGNESANDELHLVVVDEDGSITGVANTVLEKYAFLSKATNARNESGESIYWKDVIFRKSKFIYITGVPFQATGTLVDNWNVIATANSAYQTTKNTTADLAYTLRAGSDATITDGDIITAYDRIAQAEEVDVQLVMLSGHSNTVAIDVVGTVEARKDCVAFLSPALANVQATDVTTAVINYRNNALGNLSSSYVVMDSGWKYQYDKYNDTYRWIPLNGDIAGLCARTDTDRDPWFSPAGLIRGQIKNVIKLAYNPTKANRDELYKNGVNPVVSFTGEGTMLFGDKTLLGRPSAFDRINVRRLFIVLEKSIAKASRSSLFEFNDEFTRAQFVNLVEPFLRTVQGRRGIYDYRVVCDETNNTAEVIDRNEFVGDIYVKPAKSINFIQLNFVAVRTGVAFEEIVGKF